MKNIISLITLVLTFAITANAQVSATVQPTSVDMSIEVLDNISAVATYSTQNGLGDYVAVGTKYRKEIDAKVNPVFSVQGQYGIGTYTQQRAQEFLTDQTEFEFTFSYSAFAGVAIKNFDIGASLNHHFGSNRDIWLSPAISVNF